MISNKDFTAMNQSSISGGFMIRFLPELACFICNDRSYNDYAKSDYYYQLMLNGYANNEVIRDIVSCPSGFNPVSVLVRKFLHSLERTCKAVANCPGGNCYTPVDYNGATEFAATRANQTGRLLASSAPMPQ